jgi:hypothetical protein
LPVCLREVVLAFLTPTPVAFARLALPALDEPECVGWNIYFSRRRRESSDKFVAVRFVPYLPRSPFVLRVGARELDDLPALVARIKRALCDGAYCHLERTLVERLHNYLYEVSVYDIHEV